MPVGDPVAPAPAARAGRGEAVRLALLVLVAGATTMTTEMAGSRLLAPTFGSTTLVWANIIGIVLALLSVGYVVGGRIADAHPHRRSLATAALAAAVAIALIPVVAPLVLPIAALGIDDANTASAVGSFVATVVLMGPAVFLLGMVPPWAVRLALRDVGTAGRVAGGLYALSTVGSIVGTFGSALVLLPWIGTRSTFWTLAAALAIAAAVLAAGTRSPARGRHAPAPNDVAPDRALAAEVAGIGTPLAAELGSPAVPRPTASRPATALLPLWTSVAIVATSGAATMTAEFGMARLMAPFFGASTVVWATIIGTVFAWLSIGYAIGGRIADRRPTVSGLILVATLASIATALLPFAAEPVLRLSAGSIEDIAVGTLVASFGGVLLLLAAPMVLLGMLAPWAVRLALGDVGDAGRVAGRLYAASTLGSLVGTYLSVIVLVPILGTRRTILAASLVLAVLALLAGRSAARRRMAAPGEGPGRLAWLPVAAVVVAAALALLPVGLVRPASSGRVIDEGESRYQFVQVVETGTGERLLQLNEGWAVHSLYDPDTVLTRGIWDHFLVLPAMLPPAADGTADSQRDSSLLLIGNAAGTAARAYGELRPQMQVDGVELDPLVSTMGRRWFSMGGDNLRVHAGDGRPFIARSNRRWDVVHVDAYRQPYIPFYLTTREFFTEVRDHLEPGGVLTINVGSAEGDERVSRAVAATMRDVFPFVARYRAETWNEVVVATVDPDADLETLRERIRGSDFADPDLPAGADARTVRYRPDTVLLFRDFADGLREVEPDPGEVLTDDHAPVEWMTDQMIFGAADAQPGG